MLIVASIALSIFSLAYAFITDYRVMLALVLVHGVFWSGLLSASAAYMTSLLPERRRAEGIGYWGLSTVAAIAVAPTVGFWIYQRGWLWLCVVGASLNLMMAVIALNLRRDPPLAARAPARRRRPAGVARARRLGLTCSSIRSATAASPALPRCTPTRTASRRRAFI